MTAPRWLHGHAIENPAEVLAALLNPHVRTILSELAQAPGGELCAGDLKAACERATGGSREMAGMYVIFLKNAGIITFRQAGRHHFYRLVPGGLDSPIRLLEGIMDRLTKWDCAASGLPTAEAS